MANIKCYPVQYTLTQPMIDFFTVITDDEALQKRLYQTKTLFEVSEIAKEYGFDIPAVDIQKAQAGRVLAIINEGNSKEINALLNGTKPTTGAQWGRGGNGYLDRSGYWFLAMNHPQQHAKDFNLDPLFQQLQCSPSFERELETAQTINDMIDILSQHNIAIDAVDLLAYYALCILSVNDTLAAKMAR